MVEKDKFDIELESDKGKEDLLLYIKKKDIDFKEQDEARVLKRMRLIARELSFKNFSDLLVHFKKNSEEFDNALDWLQRAKVYNERINHYYPLVRKNKTITEYAQDVKKKKKKEKKGKKKRLLTNLPELQVTFGEPTDPINLELVLNVLDKKKINYQAYKANYLIRRLHHRMRRCDLSSYRKYAELLEKDPDEIILLVKSFSINVTRFFRNKDMYTALNNNIFPRIFKEQNGSINIWSAGCAVGAEPYSLAMLIDNNSSAKDRRRVNIIATDISMEFLKKAKEGLFQADLLKESSPTLTNAYFQKKGDDYRISPKLKMYINFKTHDLRNPPPAQDLDLILCRNVLIYFSQEESIKLFERMHKVLKINGYLVVGKCEMMRGKIRESFKVVDPRNRIYQKIKD
ncbi:MAG: CheR family methyltransferase [Candidatus Heimdallarchaeaceae archaeon]